MTIPRPDGPAPSSAITSTAPVDPPVSSGPLTRQSAEQLGAASNASQRAMIAAKLANLNPGRPLKTAQICAVSQSDATDMLNISRRTVQQAVTIRANAIPEVVSACEQGVISVQAAAKIAALKDRDQQKQLVTGDTATVAEQAGGEIET